MFNFETFKQTSVGMILAPREMWNRYAGQVIPMDVFWVVYVSVHVPWAFINTVVDVLYKSGFGVSSEYYLLSAIFGFLGLLAGPFVGGAVLAFVSGKFGGKKEFTSAAMVPILLGVVTSVLTMVGMFALWMGFEVFASLMIVAVTVYGFYLLYLMILDFMDVPKNRMIWCFLTILLTLFTVGILVTLMFGKGL